MRAIFFYSTLIVTSLVFFNSCQKPETENVSVEPLTEYMPLTIGKFIIYRLDSTIYTESGRKEVLHSYQEKLEVANQLTDNLGRTTFWLQRTIRDLAGQNSWSAGGSVFVTPYDTKLEVISDNLRVLRLVTPLREGTTWKAFRHISAGTDSLPSGPYDALYNFTDPINRKIKDWDFTYTGKGESLELNGKIVPDVLTVTGPDEATNFPITDPHAIAGRTYSVDKYAKNIGLVYQELIMWEYQPNPNGTPYKVGFGVKRSMLDHN